MDVASKSGATTIGFLGFNGGKLIKLVDYYIHIRSNHYGKIEDTHLILEHLICSYIAEIKKNSDANKVLKIK